MSQAPFESQQQQKQDRLLFILERLLQIESIEIKAILNAAAQLIAEELSAEKVDVFLYNPAIQTLEALGTSYTPLERRRHAPGLDRIPLINGGYIVKVFQSGDSYLTGRLDQDPDRIVDMSSAEGSEIRSEMVVALDAHGERRGVLLASSCTPDFFSAQDLQFLEGVARWTGILIHRTELSEHLRIEATQQSRRVAEELLTIVAHNLRGYLISLEQVSLCSHDLILLDVMLPDMDGFEVCRRLRYVSDRAFPIFILSGRSAVSDKILGLDSGADDYITKPFDFEELLAHIRAGLRRMRRITEESRKIVAGSVVLDPQTRQAWRDGQLLELTRREYDLLELLAHNAGHVLTKTCIFERVWGYDSDVGLEVIKVYINYLRAKLNAGGKPDLIHAIRGVGYVLKA